MASRALVPWAMIPSQSIATQTQANAQSAFNPAAAAPWRLTPWQTQGMPSGAEIAPPAAQGSALPVTDQYLGVGTSGDTDIDVTQPGGGYYDIAGYGGAVVPQPTQQAAPTGQYYGPSGEIYGSQEAAMAAHRAFDAPSYAPNKYTDAFGLPAQVGGLNDPFGGLGFMT